MRKIKLNLALMSTSNVRQALRSSNDCFINSVHERFPPNKALDIGGSVDAIRIAFSEAILQMNEAVTTHGNSEWTRDKLMNDMECLERAYRHSLGGHDNNHEIYNCMSTMRNRIELEIRREYPIEKAMELYQLLDILCDHFKQQNKGIDIVSDFIFADGKRFRKNPTLLLSKEKRLETLIAIESLDSGIQ